MTSRHVDTLLPISIIVAISFAVAWGLFELMKSTAEVKAGWYQLGGGAAGFAVVFWMLRSWYDRLDARRAEDLAIVIAHLTAASIVREGGENKFALDTSYNDDKDKLRDYFSRQDKHWLDVLLRELRTQTIRQARQQYPSLREWQPKEKVQDPVVEDIRRDITGPTA